MKQAIVGLVSGLVIGGTVLAGASGVQHRSTAPDPDGHIKLDHNDICTIYKGTDDNVLPWQGGIAAYNVQHGGTTPTPGNEWDAGGATPWLNLSDATQTKWELAAKAAILRECYPIVP